MIRRQFLASMSGAALLQAAKRPPNVVLILADDLGWGDVAMNGCPDIPTPHIDSIARQGVRFSEFYANAPECTPTRCALLTGRYQQRVGGLECAIGVNNLGRYDEAEWLQKKGELGLPATQPTLARFLRQNGYDTACIGKWHLGYGSRFGPLTHGFERYFGILGGNADYFTHQEMGEGAGTSQLYDQDSPTQRRGYLTDLFTEEALSWMRGRGSKPFFLYLPFNAPHSPIQDPDEFDAATGTAPHRNRQRSVYGKMVRRLDDSIGAILRQIDAMGAANNTLLLFLSDNGADPNGRNLPYRGAKSSVWEGGIRVPCAVRWPGRIKAGGVLAQPAMTMDLLPTILSAAGVPSSKAYPPDGIDLLPFLTATRPPVSRTLFWRYKRAAIRRKAVRDGDWKYVFDSGKEYLFHLGKDPLEQRDLIALNPQEAGGLRAKLAAWENEVRAPRLAAFRQ
ncbi:MAG: sulfatase-like hydrolase/transferase [Bryobacterales bacterium]|nr:sulfatase-like hydrolase/transferase [Bryobacterales bacterium]